MTKPLTLWAAGSLTLPLTRFLAEQRQPTATRFGPSGHLAGLIEAGARPDLFLSAHPRHARRLVDLGLALWVRDFATNDMVMLARPGVDPLTFAANVRLAMSTPGADPSGDYALQVFERLEATTPGLGRRLSERALRLVGHPGAAPVPEGRSPYAEALLADRADAFLTYRSNAVIARAEAPGLVLCELPPEARVVATFTLCPLTTEAEPLAEILGGADFAAVLQRHGFLGGPGSQAPAATG